MKNVQGSLAITIPGVDIPHQKFPFYKYQEKKNSSFCYVLEIGSIYGSGYKITVAKANFTSILSSENSAQFIKMETKSFDLTCKWIYVT